MLNKTNIIHQMARNILSLILILNISMGLADELKEQALVPVVVLDIELLGDTSVESMQADDAVLMAKFSKELRRQLKEQKIVDVLDDEHSLAVINEESKK